MRKICKKNPGKFIIQLLKRMIFHENEIHVFGRNVKRCDNTNCLILNGSMCGLLIYSIHQRLIQLRIKCGALIGMDGKVGFIIESSHAVYK